MDNRNNPYGQYLLYFLGQMMKGGGPETASLTSQNSSSRDFSESELSWKSPVAQVAELAKIAQETLAQQDTAEMDYESRPELLNLEAVDRKHKDTEAVSRPEYANMELQAKTEPETGQKYFAQDETRSSWRREERVEMLAEFCREGYAMARRHGHFLVGTGAQGNFLAIPGRFLLEEQPAGGVTGFTLWQPLVGGEELYDSLETMEDITAREVYGYWIARLDPETLTLSEV